MLDFIGDASNKKDRFSNIKGCIYGSNKAVDENVSWVIYFNHLVDKIVRIKLLYIRAWILPFATKLIT
uniref:Uncharacterized protein n=1 Tax=Setaria italica TaxID=4555 RepID=K3ZYT7_SETIT